jgi:putative aldouronate transport system substrate-binding protein
MKKGITGMAVLSLVLTLMSVPVFAGGTRQVQGTGNKVIELFETGWSTTPIEPPDPYNDYLNSLSDGYTWKLTTPADFTSELTTRAAAGSMPDVIVFNSSQLLFSLYDQGILLEDWNPYKSVMPKTFVNLGDIQTRFFTVNNKLICIPTKGGGRDWSFMIRQDWLDKLGLKMPATPDELIAVGQAFTFNDPDGNGRNDTYGFTSAGAGGLGEIANVGLFFGPTGYYVENNTVRHPIIDGNYKLTLDMIKKIVDLQIIDPDWYTRGWQERKPDLFQGKYGIVWYPPDALLSETEGGRGDGVVVNWYSAIVPLPKGSPQGGKLASTSPFGYIRTASATAGKDTEKMAVITKILENFAVPGLEYWKLLRGYQIDKYDMVEMSGGNGYFNQGPISATRGSRAGSHEGQNFGLWNWNQWISSDSPEAIAYQGSTDEPDQVTYKAVALGAQVAALPHYSGEASLLNLNNDNTQQAATVESEFAIQYILGQDSDYNGFVRRWLAAGGQALLDEAAQQLKGYGVIK